MKCSNISRCKNFNLLQIEDIFYVYHAIQFLKRTKKY